MANAHSRRNWLSRLKVDDCWHMEELDLKNSVVGAFNNLYTEEGGWRPGVEGLPFMRLDNCGAGNSLYGRGGVRGTFRSRQGG